LLNDACLGNGILFSLSEEGLVGGMVFSEIGCRVMAGILEGEEKTDEVLFGEPAIVAKAWLIGDGIRVATGTPERNMGV